MRVVQGSLYMGYVADLWSGLFGGMSVYMKARFTIEQLDVLDVMIDSWYERWEHHFRTSTPYDELKVFVRLERSLTKREEKMDEDITKYKESIEEIITKFINQEHSTIDAQEFLFSNPEITPELIEKVKLQNHKELIKFRKNVDMMSPQFLDDSKKQEKESPEEVEAWLKNWRESQPPSTVPCVSDNEIHDIYMNNFKIIMGRFNEVTELKQKVAEQKAFVEYIFNKQDKTLSKLNLCVIANSFALILLNIGFLYKYFY